MADRYHGETLASRGIGMLWDNFLDGIAEVGRVSLLVFETFRTMGHGIRSYRRIVDEMHAIGVQSLMLVLIVSLFTGAVAAVQAAYQFSNVVPLKFISSVILRSVIIELGPVLTALIIGGRVGASIAAELGTMRVTEQIDALETMAIPPVRYLILPRFIATTVMLPVITVFANFVAVAGGFVVAAMVFDQSGHTYFEAVRNTFEPKDLYSGLTKAGVFGAVIGLMGSFYGFNTQGGAEGVGLATTRAVVISSVLILISDYFMTLALLPFMNG